jgi:DNA-directed RNA polymerase subunit F
MDEILSENVITDSEAKEILKARSKEAELGLEPKNALDHLKKYNKLTMKQAENLSEELKKVEKLREKQIVAIVNILPEDNDDLRIILDKDYALFSDDEKTLILETVKKFI